jgi:hypothetical protein
MLWEFYFYRLRRDARVAEWDGLENRLALYAPRGFESLSLRELVFLAYFGCFVTLLLPVWDDLNFDN